MIAEFEEIGDEILVFEFNSDFEDELKALIR